MQLNSVSALERPLTVHSFFDEFLSTGKRQNCYVDMNSTERKSQQLEASSVERCSAFVHPGRKTTFQLYRSKADPAIDEEKSILRKRIEQLKKETKRKM